MGKTGLQAGFYYSTGHLYPWHQPVAPLPYWGWGHYIHHHTPALSYAGCRYYLVLIRSVERKCEAGLEPNQTAIANMIRG